MTTSRSPLRIHGRSAELHAVEMLLERLRAGRGGSLMLAARPGLGRSALLEHAAGALREGCVLHLRATVAERLLPFGGVHALLSAAAGRLPAPPDDVLRTGIPPAELLGVLRGMAAGGPLLICVDDAQLWDDSSLDVLGFAARRLDAAHPVGLLLTVTAQHARLPALAGIPLHTLGPLSRPAAGGLLDEHTGGGTAPGVREELLRESDGNPRLLLELAGRLTPAQLSGEDPLPYPLPATEALLETYAAQVRELPADTRLLLLLAAAAEEHHGDGSGTGIGTGLVLRAAAAAGLDPVRLGPAEASGAVRTAGGRVRFDSRLLRRAVYADEPLARRRAAHALLSSVLDDGRHRLLRLRHRASATAAGRDPELADALAEAAAAPATGPEQEPLDRSAALARAAELTVHDGTRVARLTAAAEHARLAGRPEPARSLLARVRELPACVPDSVRGRFARVDGMLALRDGPVAAARETLVHAAALLARDEPALALDALLGATEAAWAMGDPAAFVDALRRIPPSGARSPGPRSPGAGATGAGATGLLDDYRTGMHAFLSGRFADGRLLLRRAVARSGAETDPGLLRRAGVAALVLGDIDSARRADTRALATARSGGPSVLVSQVLEHLAYCELRAGRHAQARAHARDGLPEAQRTGQRNGAAHLHAILALVASVEGDAAGCREHAALAEADAAPHGLSMVTSLATWAVARAELGLGRPAEAAARLGPLVRPGPRHGHFAVRMLAVPCFVEAALLAGVPVERADTSATVEEFAHWTARSGDPQAPAQLARCRALLCPPEEAEARYAHALALHDRTEGDFERARTQLLYGKWLRRRRRPLDARDHLRDALIAFERCGARAWAGQAGEELRATGEAASAERAASPGQDGRLDGLTPQQLRIARCVAEGATNREVALRLSVSPRTVDHHLRNVFATLGVRSRVELTRLLNRAEADAEKNAEKNPAQP